MHQWFFAFHANAFNRITLLAALAAQSIAALAAPPNLPPLECGRDAVEVSYLLSELDPVPRAEQITLPPGPRPILVVPAPTLGRIRMDACVANNFSTINLRRIVVQTGSGDPTAIDVPPTIDVTAFSDYLRGAIDVGAPVHLFIPTGEPSEVGIPGVLLQSWVVGDMDFMTSAQVVRVDDGRIELFSNIVLVGAAEAGDPFASDPSDACPANSRLENATFFITNVKFKTQYCRWQREGRTMGHHFTAMTVFHDDPRIPEEHRRGVTLEGVDLQRVLRQDVNHHNGCDSFFVDFGFAAYAATATDRVGCGDVVAGAPIREANSPRALLYSISFANGGEQLEGAAQAACTHFLFDCRQRDDARRGATRRALIDVTNHGH